ncbi:hypothetical protein ACA910_008953 [Epithemia clementina (nom. ined.)]
MNEGKLWLRILHINDVYELDNLASFKTLVDCYKKAENPDPQESQQQEKKSKRQEDNDKNSNYEHEAANKTNDNSTTLGDNSSGPHCTLVVVGGDFLGPSLLSSLDQGTSMVDCLNAAGVTHVCFGNHECDVPTNTGLVKRIQQSKFFWVNSNMQDLHDKLPNNMIDKAKTPEYDIITVTNGTVTKRVALLGLLTNDPTLYRPNAFAGASIEPVIATAERMIQKLTTTSSSSNDNEDSSDGNHQQVDLIVPLTHQSIDEDRVFAQHFLNRRMGDATGDTTDNHHLPIGAAIFPLILGGHDHIPYNETIGPSSPENHATVPTSRIVKVGMDASNTGVIDIQWDLTSDSSSLPVHQPPTIRVNVVPTNIFPPDKAMVRRVKGHLRLVEQLEQARLFRIDNWLYNKRMEECGVVVSDNDGTQQPEASETDDKNTNTDCRVSPLPSSSTKTNPNKFVFTTQGNRSGPSTGTTALATIIRMGMRCECCIINAGSVRGNRMYPPDQEFFTWKDLKAELPFSTEMAAAHIPGHVLQAMLVHSRQGALQTPPVERGGYLHTCTNICYNHRTQTIERIGSEPFDPTQEYWVTFPANFLQGIDNHVPLLEWAAQQQERKPLLPQPQEGTIDAGERIVASPSSPPILSNEAARPCKLVIVEVFSALIWLQLGSFEDLDVDRDGHVTRAEVKKRLAQVLAPPPKDKMKDVPNSSNENEQKNDDQDDDDGIVDLVVDNIMSVADLDGNGRISPLELMVVHYVATDLLDHVKTDQEMAILRQTVAKVLKLPVDSPQVTEMVDKVHQRIDKSGDGRIRRTEAIEALGPLRDDKHLLT